MSGYFGTYRAVVLDAADPMGEHRVQVQVPDVTIDLPVWARPERTDVTLPNVGELVAVRFEGGDESYPVWSADLSSVDGPDTATPATTGYPGTYRGSVLDNVDPGGYGRVLVDVPEVSPGSSAWAMPEPSVSALPAVGDEVWIRFENGDVSYPTWSGGSGTGGSSQPAGETGPAATPDGASRGVVLDNHDPGGYRRVLVDVPDVSAQSMWALPGREDSAVPEIGAEVAVRFEHGSTDYPVWDLP